MPAPWRSDPPPAPDRSGFCPLFAAEATARFVFGAYDAYIPTLLEAAKPGCRAWRGRATIVLRGLDQLPSLPYGSLGWAFVQL